LSADYWLTVWDWQQERVILRTKAFSQVLSIAMSQDHSALLITFDCVCVQDVFHVTFAPDHEGRLITSGQGALFLLVILVCRWRTVCGPDHRCAVS
jgi:hypothetical protein